MIKRWSGFPPTIPTRKDLIEEALASLKTATEFARMFGAGKTEQESMAIRNALGAIVTCLASLEAERDE